MIHYDRVWAEIDLDAIIKNMESIKSRIDKNAQVVAVIKTDGYGHGATQIARVLEPDEQVWGYAVATAEEAFSLREHAIRKPILILGYTFPYSYEKLINEDVRMAVFMDDVAQMLSDKAVEMGKVCKVHVKVDTGMTRIGIRPDAEGIAFVDRLSKLPGIEIEGIFTHFATADEKDRSKTRKQYEDFCDFTEKIESELKLHIPMKHCANSASIVEMPQMHMDAVRAGIILYGYYPDADTKKTVPLKPVMTVKARVAQVRDIPAGDSIGYGRTFTADKPMRVAVFTIGYADGYPRVASNHISVVIQDKVVPTIGRICMDMAWADVTGMDVKRGDEVTVFGDCPITADTLAAAAGTISYEVTCDISKRVPRIYLGA